MLFWCFEATFTAQKMKFSIKDFFSNCDQTHSFLQIWLHLLKKSLMENFTFCAAFGHISHNVQCLLYLTNIIRVALISKQDLSADRKTSNLASHRSRCLFFYIPIKHFYFKVARVVNLKLVFTD